MKSILIVGASGGIGRVTAEYFLKQGWRVYGTNFSNDFPAKLTNHEAFLGSNMDIASEQQINNLANKIGKVDAIVNCTGVVEFEAYSNPIGNMKIWNRTMQVNFTGSYLLFELLKSKINRGGSYVMLSSTDSFFGGKVNTAYAASKSGVNSLTKSLALQFSDSGIRVNTIAPGWVETAMMEASAEGLVDYAASINPLRRNGKPLDVAYMIEFIVSSKSEYLNGQIVTLDGGYTLQDPTLMYEESGMSS